ncbi:MAG: hypothetical protein EPO21_19685 [Chloroflexota bacterium]|nr:MAG: hypothetical protein EPO21_19685 [Chloroflexota bacterium]
MARAGFVAGLMVVIALVALDIKADVGYHIQLARSGGVIRHSDAVYRLASYLDQQGGEPLALDWGIRTSIELLTQGRISPAEVFFYQKDTPPPWVDWIYGYMTREPERLYVFHADDMTVFPRRADFLALAEKIGKKAVLDQTVNQRDGRPVYLVYKVQDP